MTQHNLETLQKIEALLAGWQVRSPRLSVLLKAGEGEADALGLSVGTRTHRFHVLWGDRMPRLAFATPGWQGGVSPAMAEALARQLGKLLGLPVV